VRPHFTRDKDDNRYVALEFSLQLGDEHEKVLPKSIINEWELMKEGGRKGIELSDLGLFGFSIGLAPTGDDLDLEITAAPLESVKLMAIEDKGTGEAKDIIRLQFRASVELNADLEKFACRHFGKQIWLKMQETQGTLL
jgi:hypothetical protein